MATRKNLKRSNRNGKKLAKKHNNKRKTRKNKRGAGPLDAIKKWWSQRDIPTIIKKNEGQHSAFTPQTLPGANNPVEQRLYSDNYSPTPDIPVIKTLNKQTPLEVRMQRALDLQAELSGDNEFKIPSINKNQVNLEAFSPENILKIKEQGTKCNKMGYRIRHPIKCYRNTKKIKAAQNLANFANNNGELVTRLAHSPIKN